MTTALIDGDPLVYRAGFACQHPIWRVYLKGEEEQYGAMASFENEEEAKAWAGEGEDLVIKKESEPEPLEYTLHTVKLMVQGILDEVGATSYQLYLTGDNQFRKQIAKTKPYKGNRDPNHKPYYYNEIRKYLVDRWGAKVVDYYEADDVVVQEQWGHYKEIGKGYSFEPLLIREGDTLYKDNLKTIICTIDKDLDQCAGWHFNVTKKEKYWVTEEEATRFLYEQILSGDSVDNIPGLPKVGPIKAKKALVRCTTEQQMYQEALAMYNKHYGEGKGLEMLTETASLVYLVKEEGKHWSPPCGNP